MKEKIHPKYQETTITCGCGEVIHTRSTGKDMNIEICSKCHPFYSGKAKLVDTAGRIEKFQKRYGIRQGESSLRARGARRGKGKAPAPEAGEPQEGPQAPGQPAQTEAQAAQPSEEGTPAAPAQGEDETPAEG